MSEALVDTLARLHAVDYEGLGLRDLGKPDGFVARQIEGWYGRWQKAKVDEVAAMDAVHAWLRERTPARSAPALVHNDYKLDNVLLDARDPGRVRAVFDWDMATLGDPLCDLGALLCYWSEPGDPPAFRAMAMMPTSPGFPSRAELVERYARASGRDVSAIGFYHVLGPLPPGGDRGPDLRPLPPRADPGPALRGLPRSRARGGGGGAAREPAGRAAPVSPGHRQAPGFLLPSPILMSAHQRPQPTEFQVWGCRGSRSLVPLVSEIGNYTSCYSILHGSELFVLDGGRGLAALGRAFAERPRFRGVRRVHLLLSHAHMDHWEGIKDADWFWGQNNVELRILGTAETLGAVRTGYSHPLYVALELLAKHTVRGLSWRMLRAGERRRIAGFELRTGPLFHYSGEGRTMRMLDAIGFRLEAPDGATIAYLCDHEPRPSTAAAERALLAGRPAGGLRRALPERAQPASRARLAGARGRHGPRAPGDPRPGRAPRPRLHRPGDPGRLRQASSGRPQLRPRHRGPTLPVRRAPKRLRSPGRSAR